MSYFARPALIVWSALEWNNGAELILSDASRGPLEISTERIEQRERMANGRMRSKHIADKHSFNMNWTYLPTRSVVDGKNVVADGYASASELKQFYDAVKGEFTMKLYADTGIGPAINGQGMYDSYKVFFSSFSTSVEKRGTAFDIHSVHVTLEES